MANEKIPFPETVDLGSNLTLHPPDKTPLVRRSFVIGKGPLRELVAGLSLLAAFPGIEFSLLLPLQIGLVGADTSLLGWVSAEEEERRAWSLCQGFDLSLKRAGVLWSAEFNERWALRRQGLTHAHNPSSLPFLPPPHTHQTVSLLGTTS